MGNRAMSLGGASVSSSIKQLWNGAERQCPSRHSSNSTQGLPRAPPFPVPRPHLPFPLTSTDSPPTQDVVAAVINRGSFLIWTAVALNSSMTEGSGMNSDRAVSALVIDESLELVAAAGGGVMVRDGTQGL